MSNDADIFDRCLKYVTNFSTAIDVGAHKGVWAERMASCFGTLHCFEPNILLYRRLCTWSDGACVDVKIHNTALLDFSGRGSLYYEEGFGGKLRSYYVKEDACGDVEVRTLDSYRIRDCGLLKIDIEGGELPALRSARRILRHQKPVVVVECKGTNCVRYGWRLNDLLTYMRDLKYYVKFSSGPNLVFSREMR